MNYLALLDNNDLILCGKFICVHRINVLCGYTNYISAELILFMNSIKNGIYSGVDCISNIYVGNIQYYSIRFYGKSASIVVSCRNETKYVYIAKDLCYACRGSIYEFISIDKLYIHLMFGHGCRKDMLISR